MKEVEVDSKWEDEGGAVYINPPSSRELLEAILEAESTSAIALLRIYDVLISHYGEVNAKDAVQLGQLHNAGGIRANLPHLRIE